MSRDDVKAFAKKAMGANSQDSGFRAMYQYGYKKETLLRINRAMLEKYTGINLFIGLVAARPTLEVQIALDVKYAATKAGMLFCQFMTQISTRLRTKSGYVSK